MIKPELEALRSLAESGSYDVAPISMELLSDVRTPIEALRILLNVSRHCCIIGSYLALLHHNLVAAERVVVVVVMVLAPATKMFMIVFHNQTILLLFFAKVMKSI